MPKYEKGKMTGVSGMYSDMKNYKKFEKTREAELAKCRASDKSALTGKKTGNHSKMGY